MQSEELTNAAIFGLKADVPQSRQSVIPFTSGRFIPSLDGLRAVAVLAVICAHRHVLTKVAAHTGSAHSGPAALLLIDLGDLGVSLFFVISGYLITTLLLKQKNGRGVLSLRDFYLRRFFRIFPPYYVYLIVVCCLWLCDVAPQRPTSIISAFLYVSNYIPYRITHPEASGWLVGHTWTLSLEEQFYLAWPLVLAKLDRRTAFWVGVCAILVAPLSRVLTLSLFPAIQFDWQIVRLFHTRIDTIMAGSVLARAESKPSICHYVERFTSSAKAFLLALIALLIVLVLNAEHERFYMLAGLTIEAGLLTYVLRCSIEQAQSHVGRVLNCAPVRHIGVLSYSLYLWQQVFSFPSPLVEKLRPVPGSPLLTLILTFVCAEISFVTIERTSFQLRDRFLKP